MVFPRWKTTVKKKQNNFRSNFRPLAFFRGIYECWWTNPQKLHLDVPACHIWWHLAMVAMVHNHCCRVNEKKPHNWFKKPKALLISFIDSLYLWWFFSRSAPLFFQCWWIIRSLCLFASKRLPNRIFLLHQHLLGPLQDLLRLFSLGFLDVKFQIRWKLWSTRAFLEASQAPFPASGRFKIIIWSRKWLSLSNSSSEPFQLDLATNHIVNNHLIAAPLGKISRLPQSNTWDIDQLPYIRYGLTRDATAETSIFS